jgi:hypothetical protein
MSVAGDQGITRAAEVVYTVWASATLWGRNWETLYPHGRLSPPPTGLRHDDLDSGPQSVWPLGDGQAQ